MSTVQQQLKDTLSQAGIPYSEIQCYGSQIVVTSQSEAAALRWADLLAKIATVRGVVKALDERKVKVAHPHSRSSMQEKYVRVWRTFAAI